MPKITKDNYIRDGFIYGFIKHYTFSEPEEFEICTVEKWEKMTEDEAEKEAKGCFYESGIAEDLDIEEVDWWY